MIIITGATGTLGAQIVQQLLTRVPASQIGVSVRDPAKAADLAAQGVRVRAGDFNDPASLATSLEGARQVLLISSNTAGAEAVAVHRAAIDAARKAGARRVLYTSHQGANPASAFVPTVDHAATEQYLADSGLPFTSLRNGFYASTVPRLLGRALETGELVAPADGPVSWTTHADLAEATALALANEGTLDGIAPPLTAGEAFDLEGIARLLSERTGRTIRRVVADDQAWHDQMVAHGVPAFGASMLLGMFRASRKGEFDVVNPTLGKLLGRATQTVRDVLPET